jgi:hypothetical protein
MPQQRELRRLPLNQDYFRPTMGDRFKCEILAWLLSLFFFTVHLPRIFPAQPDDPSFRASLRWRGIRRFEIRAARRKSRLPVLFISHTLLGEFSIRVVRYVARLAQRRAKLQAQAQ